MHVPAPTDKIWAVISMFAVEIDEYRKTYSGSKEIWSRSDRLNLAVDFNPRIDVNKNARRVSDD